MTDARTQALAARYSEIYGSEEDQDYIRGAKPVQSTGKQIIAQCPACDLKATILEDRVQGLLSRWQREHERMAEVKEEAG